MAAANDTSKKMKRDISFDTTVETLFSSQHKGEALSIAAQDRKQTVVKMKQYINRILEHADGKDAAHFKKHWSKTPVIHVTGTKGKGSCCAFIESILLDHRKNIRTGLFTSPHLVRVTERFRICGKSCDDDVFVSSFWEVWDALHAGYDSDILSQHHDDCLEPVPGYFRLLTLVCMWMFAKESVEVAVIEVGCGGRFDATNIVGEEFEGWKLGKVCGCGITTLDYDHTETLGNTLTSIAWEKGGIFKPNAKLFSVPQTDEAVSSLENCIPEGGRLQFVDPASVTSQLGLSGDFQRVNAALAVALCFTIADISPQLCWAEKLVCDTEHSMATGLLKASWPGRCQTLPIGTYLNHPKCSLSSSEKVRYYLDCAHTPLSMQASLEWFKTKTETTATATNSNIRRVLVFNCSHEKDPLSLLRCLSGYTFDSAVFCPPGAGRPSRFTLPSSTQLLDNSGLMVNNAKAHLVVDQLDESSSETLLEWQFTLGEVWSALIKPSQSDSPLTVVAPNLVSALHWASTATINKEDDSNTHVHVFVVGSVYLVGGTLALLSTP